MRAGKLKFAVVAAVAWGMAVTALQGQETATPRTGTLIKAGKSSQFGRRTGSPYVELDSWIYPALERLAALGYIHSEFSDMRPWARVECGRMVQEAGMVLDVNPGGSSEAQRFYRLLRNEFELELGEMSGARGEGAVHLESLYSRVVGISGKPLNDSYHFGQTLINNYGRPYQEGFNSYNGFSGYAVGGRFAFYTRGEFQHAPDAPAYPLSARQAIASADANPLQVATPFAGKDQFRLLDAYAAVNLAGWNRFRQAELVVGAEPRRRIPGQQQRRANVHGARKPHRAVSIALDFPSTGPDEMGFVLRTAFGQSISA